MTRPNTHSVSPVNSAAALKARGEDEPCTKRNEGGLPSPPSTKGEEPLPSFLGQGQVSKRDAPPREQPQTKPRTWAQLGTTSLAGPNRGLGDAVAAASSPNENDHPYSGSELVTRNARASIQVPDVALSDDAGKNAQPTVDRTPVNVRRQPTRAAKTRARTLQQQQAAADMQGDEV
eukprot:IDg8081t1